MNRKLLYVLVSLLALTALIIPASGLLAQDEETEDIPLINDGRLNGYDIAAPVVIYYATDARQLFNTDSTPQFNEDGSLAFANVVVAIQAYVVNEEGGQIALNVLVDDMKAALEDDAAASFSANGVVLDVTSSGSFTILYGSYAFRWTDPGVFGL
jgi:hypothetical protein